MSEIVDALRGGTLREVRAPAEHRELSVTTDRTVVFSVDDSAGTCVLHAKVADGPLEGDRVFADGEGKTIVQVKTGDEQTSLHLDDGTIFHVLAVVNADGCRVATREEREHSRGLSSLLDRFLGRIR